MIVANSFDLWRKDAFFSAAEEVQESADAMESAYRTWIRERRETISPQDLDELCRELQTALGTAKWQLEEFVRAVRLSYGHCGNESATARHRQFIDAIENQILRVETSLRESLSERGRQPLQWVNLDKEECDELATFLSGTSQSSQAGKDECSELRPSMKCSPLENHAESKDADLKFNAVCDRGFSNEMKVLKDVSCIKKEENLVIKMESKEIHGRMDDIICQADRVTNKSRRTWSSPNFSELRVLIPDEDEQANNCMLCVEDTPKEKGLKSAFRKQRHGEFPQVQGAVNLFNQLFSRVGGFPRQLQSPLHLPLRCSVQVTLALVLTIFLIGNGTVSEGKVEKDACDSEVNFFPTCTAF